jgi:hypothetical protein
VGLNSETTDSFIDERRSICNTCEHRKDMIGFLPICGKCNCAIWAKTQFKGVNCPVGKWHEIKEELKGK